MSNITLFGNDRFMRQVENLFNLVHDDFWHSPAFAYSRNWRPTAVTPSDKEYKIEVELPGVKRENIEIKAVDNALSIVAHGKTFEFTRTFKYPDAKVEDSKITLEDGILTIVVPREGPKVKQLTIS